MSFDQFLAVLRAFAREGVEYVLVGGVAVNIHGIVRTTMRMPPCCASASS